MAGVTLLLFFFTASRGWAAIQFDVFLGYDGIITEATWFPVVLEIKNDGPTFVGTVELNGGQFSKGQERSATVELPTGTLKRLTIPVFASSRGFAAWDLKLLDEKGKVRAEQMGVRPRRQSASGIPLLGAIPRTASGTPQIRPVLVKQSELQPQAARLLPSLIPDNPLALEGLTCIYLNSERAADLTSGQVNALLGWLNIGGHLIVAVEQPSDISASPWLRNMLPCELKDMVAVERHAELQDWLRGATWSTNAGGFARAMNPSGQPNPDPAELPLMVANPFPELPADFSFETAPLQAAVGKTREGSILVQSDNVPLMLTTLRGRGRVTVLLFSPEREPVRSWKNLPTFWAKLMEVPGAFYVSANYSQQGSWSTDGIFGAMIETAQVHKLPLTWLLLLLIGYLVVIGPLDQYWLKRIGKPMLTWITFPCYVVLFSGVIYLIGYRLRAGETEWNDLHIVDVLVNADRAELRGRTYSSTYSPSNQRYTLTSSQKYATLRGEFLGLWGGGDTGERADILQVGDGYKADILVPVWSSQLYVSDWWEPATMPITLKLQEVAGGWSVTIENRLDCQLTHVSLVIGGRVVTVGDLDQKQTRTVPVRYGEGMELQTFVSGFGQNFLNVVQSRQRAFGSTESARIKDAPNSAMAASFVSKLGQRANYGMSSFLAPPGLDLTEAVVHGQTVLLAWADGFAPVAPVYHFKPRRSHSSTLWRVVASSHSL